MAAGNWVDWNTGDLVTAAAFQDIQDSISFIYSSESAANAALTNKVEGTQFYDTTADVLKIWDGSAWVAVGGGSIALLASGTASNSADLTFDNFADKDTYTGYKIYFDFLKPASDNVELRGTFRNGTPADITGTVVGSSAYAFMSTVGSALTTNQSTTNYIGMMPGVGNQVSETLSFKADLFLPDGTNGIATISLPYIIKEHTGNINAYYHFTRALDTQTEVKGLKFYFSSGNITSGSIYIFGVKKA